MSTYVDPAVWPYTLELCHALERAGVQYVLAIMDGPLTDAQRAQLRTLRNVEFYESNYASEWKSSDTAELERAGAWLLDLSVRCDVDLVHLNDYTHAALPWRSAPLISAVRAPAATAELQQRMSAAMRAAGALVAPARSTLNELQRVYGAAPMSWVIPPGRSGGEFTNRGKEMMIAAAGDYLDPLRNLQALTRIAGRLSWPVFLVADAPPRHAFEPLTNATFLGAMTPVDNASVLGRAAIYAHPARGGSASFDVLDAALCGCALVLGDIPELREHWDGAAMFIDPFDDESLHAALQHLMNDADARLGFGGRARQRAASFTAERMAASYLALYVEIALRAGISERARFA